MREALIVLWEAADRICGKRLKATLPRLISAMEGHGHLPRSERPSTSAHCQSGDHRPVACANPRHSGSPQEAEADDEVQPGNSRADVRGLERAGARVPCRRTSSAHVSVIQEELQQRQMIRTQVPAQAEIAAEPAVDVLHQRVGPDCLVGQCGDRCVNVLNRPRSPFRMADSSAKSPGWVPAAPALGRPSADPGSASPELALRQEKYAPPVPCSVACLTAQHCCTIGT